MVKNTKTDNKKICINCLGRNYLIECKCGCGELLFRISKKGMLTSFKRHHQNNGKNGYESRHWKGGVIKMGNYWWIYKSDHPYSTKQKRMLAHRLVYEHYLKILFDEDVYIPKGYAVHHIIPVKEGGTNALINLELLTHKEHRSRHKDNTIPNRICLLCNSKQTYVNKQNHYYWYKYEDGYVCNNCYLSLKRKPI